MMTKRVASQAIRLLWAALFALVVAAAGGAGVYAQEHGADSQPTANPSAQPNDDPSEEPTDPSRSWASAETATIHPGVQVFTDAGQCTANFVFVSGTDVLLGMAAHCAGLGAATDTNGCLAEGLPVDSEVEIQGADEPGRLAYSSWLTMQDVGETDVFTCQFNDFALVRVDPDDHDKVNPSVPFWGGPVGVRTTGTDPLEDVYSYGNSLLRAGISALSPKRGYSLGDWAEGWSHDVYTVTPGLPGDSGSAFLADDGAAFGVLTTLAAAPFPASNGVSDLARMLDYLHEHTTMTVELAEGTEPFTPGLLPIAAD